MPDASTAASAATPRTLAAPARGGAGRHALAVLFVGAVAIALSPIFVRLSEIGPTATAFYRTALAVPALFLWMALENRRAAPAAGGDDWRPFVLAGLCFAGDLAFWHWSIKFTSVANATLFANFAPVFVALGGFLVFGVRVRAGFVGALVLTLFGAVILMGDSIGLSRSHLAGDALGLVTAMFYAGYMLVVGRLRARASTARIMAWTALITSAALLPVALVSGESLLPGSARGWAVLIGLALVSHSFGQGAIAYALAHLPTAFSSVALLVQPLMAAFFAWLILHEPLTPLQGIGGAVILIGILIARRTSG
jgi:drug/metabolite transporter (DMT)-like permease